jgi:hypothetical protein
MHTVNLAALRTVATARITMHISILYVYTVTISMCPRLSKVKAKNAKAKAAPAAKKENSKDAKDLAASPATAAANLTDMLLKNKRSSSEAI